MKYLLLILSMLFLPVMADEAKILPSQTGIVEKVQYVDLNDDTVSQTKLYRLGFLPENLKVKP